MRHVAPEAQKLPVTNHWVSSERSVTTICLMLALIGLAIPYGTSTPGVDAGLTVLEWVVSGAALASAIALGVDLLRPLYPRLKASGYGYLAASAVWDTAAVYTLLHSGDIGWRYALSQALIFLALAGLTGFQWRRIVIAQKEP